MNCVLFKWTILNNGSICKDFKCFIAEQNRNNRTILAAHPAKATQWEFVCINTNLVKSGVYNTSMDSSEVLQVQGVAYLLLILTRIMTKKYSVQFGKVLLIGVMMGDTTSFLFLPGKKDFQWSIQHRKCEGKKYYKWKIKERSQYLDSYYITKAMTLDKTWEPAEFNMSRGTVEKETICYEVVNSLSLLQKECKESMEALGR